ncbi:hypothetical protein [Mesorhizobium sp.]|uniref:hypothetical protein n=1 Tax=Mesorhizobium sp. TaxID=1871066 RepID=UPI000FEA2EE6|nr:hypothetical protein [Mesorhizobium sp.]RWP82302.1 MAG: hypothetical protein EOR10_03100 [Mesorhizobium sp.]
MISGGARALDEPAWAAVDLLIIACGCEERSSSLVRSGSIRSERTIALRFAAPQNDTFKRNVLLLDAAGVAFVDDYDAFFRLRFESLVRELILTVGRPLQIGIDVSSMNRTMIASTLVSLFSLDALIDRVSVFYLPSQFVEPAIEFPLVDQVGAVVPELSGFDADPRLPFALAMGLGYEYGVGAGLINQVEPRFTLCMRSVGHDSRFEDAVRRANLNFEFGPNVEVGSYNLMDPVGSYHRLENICHGLTKNYRLVIVPLGPKLFAALSILCAIRYYGLIALWRVVAKTSPLEAKATGQCVWFTGDISDFYPGAAARSISESLSVN